MVKKHYVVTSRAGETVAGFKVAAGQPLYLTDAQAAFPLTMEWIRLVGDAPASPPPPRILPSDQLSASRGKLPLSATVQDLVSYVSGEVAALSAGMDVRSFGATAIGATDTSTLSANEAAINAAIEQYERIYIPTGCHYRRGNLSAHRSKLIIDDSRGARITSQDIDWQPKVRPVELIAHRCWPYQAPENTLPAAARAVASGARSLETDWAITKDGHVVCHHDDTLTRCTNGALTGNIWDYNLSELQAVEFGAFFSPSYAGTPIMTAEQFVQFAKARGCLIYPEIKNYRTQADIDLMLQVIFDNDAEDMTVFTSFSISDLTYVRQRSNRIGVGLAASNLTNLEPLARLGRAQLWPSQATLRSNLGWIGTARAAGVDVAPWTMAYNDGANVQQLQAAGVFRFVTNDIF